jgi:hypothetical protein
MGFFSESEEEQYEREAFNHYNATFTGPSGEWVLKDLYHQCGMGGSPFKDADFDPIQAAFKDGMAYVVKRLLGYSGREPFNL